MSDQTQLVQQAASLLKAGKKEEARQILVQFVRQEPNHVFAWYVLSFCLDDISQKRSCLQRALAIDPKSVPVKQALDKLNNTTPQVPTTAPVELRPTPSPVPQSSTTTPAAPVQANIPSPKAGEVPPPPPSDPAPVPTAQQPVSAPAPSSSTPPASPKTPSPARPAPVAKKTMPPPVAKKKNNNLLIFGGIILGALILGLGILPLINKTSGLTFGILLVLAAITYVVFQIYTQQTATRKLSLPLARSGPPQTEQSFADLIADPGEGFKLIRNIAASNGTISYLILSETGGVFPIDAPLYVGKIEFKQEQLTVNGKPPERDFIEISLQNAFWLRDKLEPIIGTKPWITPILVFPNASVPYTLPLKGVHVLGQKNLFTTLQAEAAKRSNSLVWEKSEEIRQILNAE
jgi:hypothetical protein